MAALILALLEHPEEQAEVAGCLRGVGHQVIVVDSFARAMSILQEHAFDLIISDVHLENGGSIFDLLKWVKSKPALHPIPFILLSVRPTKMAKYLAEGVLMTARTFGASKCISMDTFNGAQFAQEIAELLVPNPTAITIKEQGD